MTKLNLVTAGSKWTAMHTKFRVISTVEINEQIWVHYIKDDVDDPTEYSCHLESFLSRFFQVINE